MHPARSQIIEIIVSQKHTAYQHSDHPTHIQSLRDHVAQNPEKKGYRYLGDLVVNQKAEIAEQHWADYSWIGDGLPQAAPIPSDADTVSRNFQVISHAIWPAFD